jgi:hypothetical protein
MKKYLALLIILMLLIASTSWADYTCTVPTDGTFNECVALCDGKTGVVTIDVTGATFTMSSFSMVDWEATSVVIKGAGRDTTTCTSAAATITTLATIPVEIYGITFSYSLTMTGNPLSFKIHDNTFASGATLSIEWTGGAGHPYGVIYGNNLHKVTVVPQAANRFDYIHALFYQAPPLGNAGSTSNGVVYIEGNTYLDRGYGYLTDAENGARMVFRYNTIQAVASNANLACHSINASSTYSGSTYVMRGNQMWEWYKNDYTNSVYSLAFTQIRSGTGVFFDNKINRSGGGLAAIHIDNDRSNYSTSYADGKCRGHFDWDGNETIDATQSVLTTYYGATHFSGTHSGDNNAAILTDSTAAWTSSRLAPSTTSAGTTVYNVTDGSKCLVTANDGTTITCTLAGGTDNDWDTGDSYRISDGYPCRDQIGHTYLDAELFDNNPITVSADQSLYPMYVWGNTRNDVAMNTISVNASGSNKHILNNRDYFTAASASCTAGGACTSGVGSGSALPTSCTVNTAFWDTDESALYRCTTTDTWTKYYEPATCPHPLAGAGECSGVGAGGYLLGGTPPIYTATSSVVNAAGGTISGSQSVESGSTTTFTYEAFNGWKFKAWAGTCGGSGTTTYTTNAISADCTVTAEFEEIKLNTFCR